MNFESCSLTGEVLWKTKPRRWILWHSCSYPNLMNIQSKAHGGRHSDNCVLSVSRGLLFNQISCFDISICVYFKESWPKKDRIYSKHSSSWAKLRGYTFFGNQARWAHLNTFRKKNVLFCFKHIRGKSHCLNNPQYTDTTCYKGKKEYIFYVLCLCVSYITYSNQLCATVTWDKTENIYSIT